MSQESAMNWKPHNSPATYNYPDSAPPNHYRLGKAGFLVEGRYGLAHRFSTLPFGKMNWRTLQRTLMLGSHFRPIQQISWGQGLKLGIAFFPENLFKDAQQKRTTSLAEEMRQLH